MAFKHSILTAERLRELLRYDPETGIFTWRTNRRGGARAGNIAGCKTDGYIQIHVDGEIHRAHRLVWLYVTGKWPVLYLDHKNGSRNDNRFSNLREATKAQNNRNHRPHPNSKSGFKGVSTDHGYGWRARCAEQYLGFFRSPEEAAKAYDRAAREKWGEFAVLNFPDDTTSRAER